MNRRVNIADLGAIAGKDCRPAIYRAMASLPPGPGVVSIPTGDWTFTPPLCLDRDQTSFVGEDPRATILGAADHGNGLFVWPRAAMPAAVRPDAYGILDNAACPFPRYRYGLSVGAGPVESWAIAPAFPPSTGRGDHWRNGPGLTLSFLLGGTPAGGALFGMGDTEGPGPWLLDHYYEPGVGHRIFRLSFYAEPAGRVEGDPPRVLTFGNVDAIRANPCRVDLQIQFDRVDASGLCEARAWIDGTERWVDRGYGTRLVRSNGREPSFAPSDGLRFRPNKLYTFHLGNGCRHDNVTQGKGGRYDLFGLCLGVDRAFDSDGAGKLVRADGGPVDDGYRYLGTGRDRAALVARLLLDPVPTDDPSSVRFTTASANVIGHVVSSPIPLKGITIRDLSVRSLGLGGAGILLGPLIDFRMERVAATQGTYGLLGLNCGATYDLTLRGCSLYGSDAWVRLTDSIVDCDGLARGYVPGVAVRLSGCAAHFGPIRTGDVNGPDRRVVEILDDFTYTSHYQFDGPIDVDQEGGKAATAVYCEKHKTGGTDLTLGPVYPGLRDGVTPAVELVDHFPTKGKGGIGPGSLHAGPIGGDVPVQSEGDWQAEGR